MQKVNLTGKIREMWFPHSSVVSALRDHTIGPRFASKLGQSSFNHHPFVVHKISTKPDTELNTGSSG